MLWQVLPESENLRSQTFCTPVSRDAASARLAPGLAIRTDRLAVIPTEGKGERFCREFLCDTPSGGKCLVYVDAVTGEEAKVLLLLEDADGTLTV